MILLPILTAKTRIFFFIFKETNDHEFIFFLVLSRFLEYSIKS